MLKIVVVFLVAVLAFGSVSAFAATPYEWTGQHWVLMDESERDMFVSDAMTALNPVVAALGGKKFKYPVSEYVHRVTLWYEVHGLEKHIYEVLDDAIHDKL